MQCAGNVPYQVSSLGKFQSSNNRLLTLSAPFMRRLSFISWLRQDPCGHVRCTVQNLLPFLVPKTPLIPRLSKRWYIEPLVGEGSLKLELLL